MRKQIRRIIAMLFCGYATLSCTKEQETSFEQNGELHQVTISADIAKESDTRVAMGETVEKVTPLYWENGDAFDLKIGNTGYKFTIAEIKEDKRRAEFTCAAAPADIPAGTHTAIYPSGFTTLPQGQIGTEADLDKYYYMTARCEVQDNQTWEDISLNFKSEVAIVKMSLTHKDFVDKTVYHVTLLNDEAVVAKTSTDLFITSFKGNKNGTIEVYLAVMGDTSFSNASITAQCNGRNYTAKINNSNTLKAGKIYNITKNMTTILPSIETITVSDITSTSAMSGGTISDEGQSAIIAKGVVWSTEYNPTIDLSTKTIEGEGTTDFTSILNSLNPYTVYYVRAYATNAQGTAYGSNRSFRTLNAIDYENAIDLSENGSANCYIVSTSGSYKIKAVKGNSSAQIGTCVSADVLWESFGTSSAPYTGDLISLVDYRDNYIYFKTHTTYKEGNSVIAAQDSNGTILWSWHIWMTNDDIQSHVHSKNAGTMMDRNLGATSAEPADMGSYGLLYQWGRKDPFLSGSNRSNMTSFNPTMCASTNKANWVSETSTESTGTIQYAIEHPMTYIKGNTKNYDWYYMTTYTTESSRWGTSKTVYDPCPSGWKVPEAGKNSDDVGVWGYIPYGNEVFPWNYQGGMGIIIPATYCGSDAWYPAAGYWDGSKLTRCGHSGRYWACNVWNSETATFICLSFNYNYNADDDVAMCSQAGVSGAYAQSVRCVKE